MSLPETPEARKGNYRTNTNKYAAIWAGDRSGDSSRAKFKRFQRSLFAVTEQHDPPEFRQSKSRSRSLERNAIGCPQ
ncbi:hypothetical protein H6F51_24750 [Cyanobacteria bacterium FACHB-DQ100]|nr:hypothetical protein [Cyanobacteria bacterium FACHB-DQ100]